jgi:hypothetical protein
MAAFAAKLAISFVASYVIGEVFGPGQQQVEGPRLQDLRAQASTLGGGKPLVKGEARYAGMMIWATPFVEHASSSSGGGKGGGGGAAVTNYTYTQSMAIALGDVQIIGVRKIWANGKLIYTAGDATSNAGIISDNAAQTAFTVYQGTETQTPNSFIQASQDTKANTYYFTPSETSTPTMTVQVSGGGLTVSGSLVTQDTQHSTVIISPVSNPRIDRVVLSKTTGIISVVPGAEAGTPVPPAIPVGNYPCCNIYLNTTTWWTANRPGETPVIENSAITDNKQKAWATGTTYAVDDYVNSGGYLFKCKVGGISGPTPPRSSIDVAWPDYYDGRWQHNGSLLSIDYLAGAFVGGCVWTRVEAYNAIPSVATPAYRGTPYIVFYDYALGASGNTTPNFEFQVVEGTHALDAIVLWAAELADLQSSQVDVTSLAGINVQGFTVANRSTMRSVLEPLSNAFFFDCLESDGLLKFVLRGGLLAGTILEDDLAAHTYGSQMPSQMTRLRAQEQSLPQVVTVQYANQNNSYQTGSKYHRMQNTHSVLEQNVQLPIAMNDSDGQSIANKLLNCAWYGRTTYAFATGRKCCHYEPTDIIAVEKDGVVYEVRITNKSESAAGVFTFQAVDEDIGLYSNKLNTLLDNIKAPAPFDQPPGSVAVPLLMDAPGILTTDGLEAWCAVGSANLAWGGCGVFVSSDNLNFVQVGTLHGSAIYGTISMPLSTTDPDVTTLPVVNLGISGTQLGSVSQADADAKLSLCYADGELISYETSTLVAANLYQLSYLRRSVYNSAAPAARSNVDFARLDDKIFKYPYQKELLGTTLYFKFPSFNTHGLAAEDLSVAVTYSHVLGGSISFPNNVTGFFASQNGNVTVLQWDHASESLAYIAGYEFRYIPAGSGLAWTSGVPITKTTRGTSITTAKIPPGDWTLMCCAVDLSGNYSKTPATFNITVVNQNDLLLGGQEAPDWLGTLTHMIKHWTGVIYPDSQNLASADGWDTFDVFVMNPFPICTYDDRTVDIGFDGEVRVWQVSAGNIPPTSVGTFDPAYFIDYSTTAGPYSGWTAWAIGSITARYVQQRISIDTSLGVSVTTSFTPTVDALPFTQNGTLIVAPGGTAVVFPIRYHRTPSIQLTVVGASGLIAVDYSPSVTGFTAHVFDLSDVDVGGTVNWTSTGV